MPSFLVENDHGTGWVYREPFTIDLPLGAKLDAHCDIPISISSQGLEIGTVPDRVLTWAEIEAMREKAKRVNKRSWLSMQFLKLAARFK